MNTTGILEFELIINKFFLFADETIVVSITVTISVIFEMVGTMTRGMVGDLARAYHIE